MCGFGRPSRWLQLCRPGSSHALPASSVVAHACRISADAAGPEAFLQRVEAGAIDAVFIGRGFDATPLTVSFGRLQSILSPSARYLLPNPDTSPQRWRRAVIEEYRQAVGH